jgi:flagellar motor switch protein FliN/FliY
MTAFFNCWFNAATALFAQALAGEPKLAEAPAASLAHGAFAFAATLGGDQEGRFAVIVDRAALDAPLMGEGVDQKAAWGELFREVAEAAIGDLLVRTGRKCRVESFGEIDPPQETGPGTFRAFQLTGPERSWTLLVHDEVNAAQPAQSPAPADSQAPAHPAEQRAGLDLLLDVELEATLRFGCRELPLGEILDLGPGDVVQLDRTVRDPVDLIVGDKIVARGEVVLVNGNFGLRVTEVAAPRKRLESIRCLF